MRAFRIHLAPVPLSPILVLLVVYFASFIANPQRASLVEENSLLAHILDSLLKQSELHERAPTI